MKFSIQEEGKEKEVFMTFQSASYATGIPYSNIRYVLKKDSGIYKRRKDGKKFLIKNEEESVLAKINGKEYASFSEIQNDFGISQTVFINHLLSKKKYFVDASGEFHKVEKSEELEKFLSKFKNIRMQMKKGFES